MQITKLQTQNYKHIVLHILYMPIILHEYGTKGTC